MTMTHFFILLVIFHPNHSLINPFVIVFKPTHWSIYTAHKMLNTKKRFSYFYKNKKSRNIKMLSNDDYEFEDLANQMSQTQLNESGNVGGLSML